MLGVQSFFFFPLFVLFLFLLNKETLFLFCFVIEDMVDIVSSSSGIHYVTKAEHLYFNMKYFLNVAEYILLTYLILSPCYPC